VGIVGARSDKVAGRKTSDVSGTIWTFVIAESGSCYAIVGDKTLSVAPHREHRLRRILQELSSDDQSSVVISEHQADLTPRQTEIVAMIKCGASNKAIASSLGLSVGTVKVHLNRIFRALNVNSRTQLATMRH
jgi:DNA-binding CsgD family transcriptional regulator